MPGIDMAAMGKAALRERACPPRRPGMQQRSFSGCTVAIGGELCPQSLRLHLCPRGPSLLAMKRSPFCFRRRWMQ